MIEVPEEKEAAVGCGCCGPHAAAAAPAASEPASLPELASPPCSPRSPAYGPTSPGASYSPLPEVEDAEDARQAMVRERKQMAQAIALRHYDIQTSRGERTTRSGALFKKNAARTARGKPVFSVEALIVWWLANPRPLISRDEHPQIEADKRAQDQWYRVRDEFLGDVDEDTAIQLVYDTLSWEAEATIKRTPPPSLDLFFASVDACNEEQNPIITSQHPEAQEFRQYAADHVRLVPGIFNLVSLMFLVDEVHVDAKYALASKNDVDLRADTLVAFVILMHKKGHYHHATIRLSDYPISYTLVKAILMSYEARLKQDPAVELDDEELHPDVTRPRAFSPLSYMIWRVVRDAESPQDDVDVYLRARGMDKVSADQAVAAYSEHVNRNYASDPAPAAAAAAAASSSSVPAAAAAAAPAAAAPLHTLTVCDDPWCSRQIPTTTKRNANGRRYCGGCTYLNGEGE